MKTVSNAYINKLKEFGREIDSKITYLSGSEEIELGNSELNSISYHYESDILKSVMKQLDVDSNEEIPVGTEINFQFGVKTGNNYEYINYGNYIVYQVEKQEDTNSYKLTCYDKMLYAMKDYEDLGITYPITIRNYINALCTHIGLTFKNTSDAFANYDKEIQDELYLNGDGESIGYTYRDVLDELAQATGSIICIDEASDKLEIRYIDEEHEASKNLLNTNSYTLGYYNTNGEIVSSTTRAIFNQKIELQPNTTYCYSANQNVSILSIIWFDENNDFISTTNYGSRSEQTLRLPTGAKYLMLGIQKNNSDITDSVISGLQLMLEKNITRTSYEPYVQPTLVVDTKMLKDVNVNFGEKYGPINSIVISRGAESDNVYIQDEDSIEQNGLCEIKISENQILKGNDRSDYLEDLLEKLDGLEYYLNDYSSTGITIFEPADLYKVEIDNTQYKCIAFNDEVNISQGLSENVHTDLPQESETDYTKADKTDRKINQTTLIVDKHEQEIQALIEMVQDISNVVNGTGSVILENAHEGGLHKIEISGSISLVYPNNSAKVNDIVPYGNNTLYPSTTLYPKDSYLQVDDTLYRLDLNFLNYMSTTIHDKYVYLEGKQWIERNVGIDSNGNMYALDETIIEEKEDIIINVKSNSTITLQSFGNGLLSVEYLLENKYTDAFATQVDVKSEIKQTADAIELQVNEKVNEDEIIAKINLAVEKEQGIIQLTGNSVLIDSDNFHLDSNGDLECSNAQINDGNIKLYGGTTIPKITLYSTSDNSRTEITPGSLINYDSNNQAKAQFLYGSSMIALRSRSQDTSIVQNGDGIYLKNNDNDLIILDPSSGNITCVSLTQTSLEENKKNIEKYNGALKEIMNTDIYEYNLNNEEDNEKKHLGFVIGKNRKYSKEIVACDKNGKEIGVDNYSMTSLCFQAIKEQQEQIEKLQKEIKLLKEGKND